MMPDLSYFDIIKDKGATGFDRDVRVKEACRVTAYPYPSGTKHNCRLSRVSTSRLIAATSYGLSACFKSDMASCKQDSHIECLYGMVKPYRLGQGKTR
jgi:hypothetical protein